MNIITDWPQVPHGIFLMRMFHESRGEHVLHLHLKVSDAPWYDQPSIPAAVSQAASGGEEFWDWAEQNLPIFDYPSPLPAT